MEDKSPSSIAKYEVRDTVHPELKNVVINLRSSEQESRKTQETRINKRAIFRAVASKVGTYKRCGLPHTSFFMFVL